MSDKENVENQTIDPPDNQGGGELDPESEPDAQPIDPPDNQGGGN